MLHVHVHSQFCSHPTSMQLESNTCCILPHHDHSLAKMIHSRSTTPLVIKIDPKWRSKKSRAAKIHTNSKSQRSILPEGCLVKSGHAIFFKEPVQHETTSAGHTDKNANAQRKLRHVFLKSRCFFFATLCATVHWWQVMVVTLTEEI